MGRTLADVLRSLPRALNPQAGAGLRATIELCLKGEEGGTYCLEIADGRCVVRPGSEPNPTLRIETSVADYLELVAQRQRAGELEAAGRLRLSGDRALAARLPELFRPTPEQIFALMPEHFNAAAAAGLDTVVQIVLTGGQPVARHIVIRGRRCEVRDGEHPKPGATITLSADDFVDLALGKLEAQAAYMQGRLRVSGDLALAIRLVAVFPPG